MSPRTIGFDIVRKLGLALPDVEEGTTYGSPALKVRGKLLTCLAVHRSAEPASLVVVVGFETRGRLIAADPTTYYLTEHYRNHPVVLVRLSRIHLGALRDLLSAAWQVVTAGARRSSRAVRRQSDPAAAAGRPARPRSA